MAKIRRDWGGKEFRGGGKNRKSEQCTGEYMDDSEATSAFVFWQTARHLSGPNRQNSMMWLHQPSNRFTYYTSVALTHLYGGILLL